jgi:hypothetical protein
MVKKSSKGKVSNKKKSKKKVKQTKGIDGFTNEERLKMDKKVINKYYKLFSNNEYAKIHKVKPGYVLYPLDDARTVTPITSLLSRYTNKDGSLKISLKKNIKNCLNKTLYLCK